jgi:hypothetical protein
MVFSRKSRYLLSRNNFHRSKAERKGLAALLVQDFFKWLGSHSRQQTFFRIEQWSAIIPVETELCRIVAVNTIPP